MTDPRATVVDLFSGAGGLSLGFNAAGARLLAAVDANEVAGRTLSTNFGRIQPKSPPHVFAGADGNIEKLDLEQIAPRGAGPDILVGGPPCQGFSRVGRAKLRSLERLKPRPAEDPDAGDPRNELYRRFVNAALFWQPRVLLMENVPGMLSLHGKNVAIPIAADLAACGYRVGYALLNAVWYGVPQFRERLFFVGIREDLRLEPSVPAPTHTTEMPSGYLRPTEEISLSFDFAQHFRLGMRTDLAIHPATTIREALDDLPSTVDHLLPEKSRVRPEDLRELHPYPGSPQSAFARLMRGWPGLGVPEGVRGHVVRRTPRDFETFRRMKPDDRYKEALTIARTRFREELDRLATEGTAPRPGTTEYEDLEELFIPPYPESQFVDKWRKLNPDRPSWTIPAHLSRDGYSHIHHDSEQARAISVREAARIQSFPDAFEFSGNMGDCFTQIGNAVPPVLAWALASHLLRLIKAPMTPCPLASPAP